MAERGAKLLCLAHVRACGLPHLDLLQAKHWQARLSEVTSDLSRPEGHLRARVAELEQRLQEIEPALAEKAAAIAGLEAEVDARSAELAASEEQLAQRGVQLAQHTVGMWEERERAEDLERRLEQEAGGKAAAKLQLQQLARKLARAVENEAAALAACGRRSQVAPLKKEVEKLKRLLADRYWDH